MCEHVSFISYIKIAHDPYISGEVLPPSDGILFSRSLPPVDTSAITRWEKVFEMTIFVE